ncbi:MAG: hypothetical protein QN147_03565 [Armatimonadota bacterium]|nr:hypothetical protein [Armatimonadota bacterium]
MIRVDAVDVGAVLARLSVDPPPGLRAFPVEGPEALTGPQIAAIWAEELGRDVTCAGDDNDRWEPALRRGLTGAEMELFVKVYRLMPKARMPVSKKRLAITTELLGRPPRTYRDYVRRRVQELRRQGSAEPGPGPREAAG